MSSSDKVWFGYSDFAMPSTSLLNWVLGVLRTVRGHTHCTDLPGCRAAFSWRHRCRIASRSRDPRRTPPRGGTRCLEDKSLVWHFYGVLCYFPWIFWRTRTTNCVSSSLHMFSIMWVLYTLVFFKSVHSSLYQTIVQWRYVEPSLVHIYVFIIDENNEEKLIKAMTFFFTRRCRSGFGSPKHNMAFSPHSVIIISIPSFGVPWLTSVYG